jgi:hypothetical protein
MVGTSQTPQTPPRTRQSAAPAATPPAAAPQTAARPAGKADTRTPDNLAVDEPSRERPGAERPYFKLAFANPYNLSLLCGGLTVAALTANPLLAILTLGLEGLWILHAPDSFQLRRLLWDPQFERLRGELAAAERAQRMQPLDHGARARVEALVERQAEIHRLAAQNPSFAGDLLRNELGKTDRLVAAFLDMSLTCRRYEGYLQQVDTDQLNRERKRYGLIAKAGAADDPEAQIAQKNVDVTDKRIAKLEEIKHYLQVARGQLDLIENSFQLLVEQIVTMQSPRELSGQLDELLDGVEAIRETTRDTEKIIGRLDNDA